MKNRATRQQPKKSKAPPPRDRQIHLLASAEDVARLEALAEHHEMNASQVIRMLIKREAERVERGKR